MLIFLLIIKIKNHKVKRLPDQVVFTIFLKILYLLSKLRILGIDEL